jgi:hypothetical protein
MASLIYDNFLHSLVQGGFNFNTDTVKVLLVTSGFAPTRARTDARRRDERDVGTGYTAGGNPDHGDLHQGHHQPPGRPDVLERHLEHRDHHGARGDHLQGGRRTAAGDALIAYVDFGQDVSSTAAAFSVTFSSALRFQN